MELIEVLNHRQQVWLINDRSYVISRVKDVAQLGYETMIFTTESWYGYEPLIDVWADIGNDNFISFKDAAHQFSLSMEADL